MLASPVTLSQERSDSEILDKSHKSLYGRNRFILKTKVLWWADKNLRILVGKRVPSHNSMKFKDWYFFVNVTYFFTGHISDWCVWNVKKYVATRYAAATNPINMRTEIIRKKKTISIRNNMHISLMDLNIFLKTCRQEQVVIMIRIIYQLFKFEGSEVI